MKNNQSELEEILYKHCEELTDVQHIKLREALLKWRTDSTLQMLPEKKDWSKDPTDEWEQAEWVGYNKAISEMERRLNEN